MKKISVIAATLVGAAVLCAAPISLQLSQDKGLTLSVDKARARIGRPLTPGSVAGVHRRHHRRAYRHGYYGQGYYGHGGPSTSQYSHQTNLAAAASDIRGGEPAGEAGNSDTAPRPKYTDPRRSGPRRVYRRH